MPDKENRDSISERTRLLNGSGRTFSDLNSEGGDRVPSFDTVVFDSRLVKTSTRDDDLAATWGGRRSLPDSGRLRRVHSWSGGPPDDGSSEIRILRERVKLWRRTAWRVTPQLHHRPCDDRWQSFEDAASQRERARYIDTKGTLRADGDEQGKELFQVLRPTLHTNSDRWDFTDVALLQTTSVGLAPCGVGLRNTAEQICKVMDHPVRHDNSTEDRVLPWRLVRTQTRLRPGAVRHLSRRQRLTLASLAMVDFMSFCSMSIMAPFFPREASNKGLSDTMCGLVFSFYAIIMFVTSPVFGKFLPALGAKFLFTIGMFVAGACNMLFGTLVLIEDTTTFTVMCFVIRGLEALGASAYSTASYVFVVNAFPQSIGSVLGILETFVGLGMSVGPAMGGLLYSIGGFGLPFYVLGIVMVLSVPINFFLLTDCQEYVSGSKSASILSLFKIPSIIITGLVIVIVSNTWAFLDPTLEPHLRQFNLSTKQIGLIFLLFSALYGIFSPIWGWVADRVNNHWCMMVWGLFLSTLGLLLLGPCPFIPGLPEDLWLDLVALSILGISVALTLLPTFQGVLTSSIYEGGCPEALATYSAVAGVWSCCYSLGEVLGPALGGALAQRYGFPLCATLCAAACFTMGVVTLTFFSLRESAKWLESDTMSRSDSIPYTDTTWNSGQFCRTRSAPASQGDRSPLLAPCACCSKNSYASYGENAMAQMHLCVKRNKKKSGAASISDAVAYFLKFQYLTDMYIKLRSRKPKPSTNNRELYQNYLAKDENAEKPNRSNFVTVNNNKLKGAREDKYCAYLEDTIFGTPELVENVNMDKIMVKKNNKGLVSMSTSRSVEDEKKTTFDLIRHNLEKVQFYEQTQACMSLEDIFDGCNCRGEVTYVRGTVTVSSAGACEV